MVIFNRFQRFSLLPVVGAGRIRKEPRAPEIEALGPIPLLSALSLIGPCPLPTDDDVMCASMGCFMRRSSTGSFARLR